MNRRVLIAGIGNVLQRVPLGDDVEIADLGTPALELTHRIAGLHALILVDSSPPGNILPGQYCSIGNPRPSVDRPSTGSHSPALSECLLIAEMLGSGPEHGH